MGAAITIDHVIISHVIHTEIKNNKTFIWYITQTRYLNNNFEQLLHNCLYKILMNYLPSILSKLIPSLAQPFLPYINLAADDI